jgi:GntR family transcriptional regulator, transcriptional repressor for pyruvate dehydrogenase complex
MADNPLVFNAITRNPSLYETVSEQLLAAIRDAGLQPGSRIPSERDLGEQFGVSRTVIREAIRHLSAKGVLQVMSGSGVLVADVGHEGVSESIDLYLRQRGPVRPEQIHEVRESLELTTTGLAAVRASDEQIAAIRDICESMADSLGDADAASRADVAFHRAIAEATGNPLFLVLIDSLGDVLMEIRRATLGEPGRGEVALAAHRSVAEALGRRDAAGAVAALRAHLVDSRDAFGRVAGEG